ncbi:MAG: tRNA lysidine(34) synthetase TilS [bacterium]
MLRLLMKVPREICVAVSGGPDSMAALDFLRRGHDVKILHFNHGTEHGAVAEAFVSEYAREHNIPITVGHLYGLMADGESKEKFWRDNRYQFFDEEADNVLVMAHNLDDAVETWIFNAINGQPRTIPPTRPIFPGGNFLIRPFLTTKKSELRDWCKRKDVPFIDDPSNNDLSYPRVRLRNVIIPELLKINPGLYKVVAKKYMRWV